jgi:hypothetical protein
MKTLLAIILLALATSAQAQITNRFAATIFRSLTNDLVITNQTNYVTVTNLSVTIEPNKKYAVALFPLLSATNNSTALQIVASNATVYGLWDGIGTGSYGTNLLTNENGFSITTMRAPAQVFYVVGGTNTNAGSINVQFRSSVATNTNTFHTGSYIRADKMP